MRTEDQINDIVSELRRMADNDCVEQFDAHDHHICLAAAAEIERLQKLADLWAPKLTSTAGNIVVQPIR